MRKFFCLSVFYLIIAVPAFALLPPLYESIKEIEAILNDTFLTDFSGEEILSIQKEEEGYLIETTNYFFFAQIIPSPSSKVGPLEFTVSFKEPTCKSSS